MSSETPAVWPPFERVGFVLIIPNIDNAVKFANQLTLELTALSPQTDCEIADFCHIGDYPFSTGDKPDELLANADTALAHRREQVSMPGTSSPGQSRNSLMPAANIGDWRHIFNDAMNKTLQAGAHPVVDPTGAQHCHQEAVFRHSMPARTETGLPQAISSRHLHRLNLTGPSI